jgi:carbamoyltransferase
MGAAHAPKGARLAAAVSAVLGISAQYHDSAAALVVDGQLVAAMQEERFSRVKNDAGLPVAAARACLAQAGLSVADLSAVVFYENPFAKLERVLVGTLRSFPRSFRKFPRMIREQLGHKIWVLDDIASGLGVPREKVQHDDHHACHAASAFYLSPFQEAAVITVDGVGEGVTTTISKGDGTTLTRLRALPYPHSLGLLYGALTAYLGFEVNEGEYKVMGLAAYGKPTRRDELARVITTSKDGSFELAAEYFAYDTDADVGFSSAMETLLGPRRLPGRPWDLSGSAEDQGYADIAASLQAATTDALVGLAQEAKRLTGSNNLCLAGGVALNAVANREILRSGGFSRVFVPPAAGDAGGAVGAALRYAYSHGAPRGKALVTAALGADIHTARAHDTAVAMGLTVGRASNAFTTVADALERGDVVAVASGRFELGPRALGQRSILALPEDPNVRERINRVIKRREPFRPFAPSVLLERASDYFHGAPNDMTPFMVTVCDVKSDAKEKLGAITHVDGTARVQTVTTQGAPLLAGILEELQSRGRLPVVLNTSLNGAGEPIVGSGEDALAFFDSHPVDAMLLGEDLWLTRKEDS